MRRIKFRAWDKKTKQMFYKMPYTPHLEIDALDISSCLPYQHYILMQYTGLKDKNGKEIYEGDIVELYTEEDYSIIKRCGGGFYEEWHISREHTDNKSMAGDIAPNLEREKLDREIIGNIYENKDLIK